MLGPVETLMQTTFLTPKHRTASTLCQDPQTPNTDRLPLTQTSQFSLSLSQYPQKLYTKLSKATKCTLTSQSVDTESIEDNKEDRFITYDSKAQQCHGYFNRMCCQQGQECMFSHQSEDRIEGKRDRTSLFQLLEEYPELVIAKGARRQYSMFFN